MAANIGGEDTPIGVCLDAIVKKDSHTPAKSGVVMFIVAAVFSARTSR